MDKSGPIIIIEDDLDDQAIFSEAFSELGYKNEIVYFTDGVKALRHLEDENIFPFLILSDINLPKLNGLELKAMIQNNSKLGKKCIPYLFFTTVASENSVYEAYTTSAQGFFVKPADSNSLKS
jgi:CheY-like chemotaxis protein